ncbi:hypothetical protein T265_09000 [Opisthorchis viverrini]|uniref:Intraflagellar transport protein 43 homolog n=1 Tax=Opisthorchis viverrini TaxID=6198 RepID=A0A074Z7H4_OPIVI|nr:hypothetical protein T265_09000 [Opisthorchis viverrini]KER23058.1 hypothetical protein T265_09000 [Opisthorchis viverrini]
MIDEIDFDRKQSKEHPHKRQPVDTISPTEDKLSTSLEKSESLISKPPSRKLGGWGKEGTVQGILHGRRAQPQLPNSSGILTFKGDSDSDDEMNIPVIPDVTDKEQLQSSPLTAEPPNVPMSRLLSYQELNAELKQGVAFQLLDNEINLKLLTNFLSPESAVQEKDEIWDWDRLIADVAAVSDNV